MGTVQQGIEYADELPKLHKEIKRDVSWVGAVSAQADMTIRKACYLTKVVKASKRYVAAGLWLQQSMRTGCCHTLSNSTSCFPAQLAAQCLLRSGCLPESMNKIGS